MKRVTAILFLMSVSVFTLLSKGCGDYQNRLEADLRSRVADRLPGANAYTLGLVAVAVDRYQLTISGKVGSAEEREAIGEMLSEAVPAGRGRVHNGLEVGRVGPYVSGVEIVRDGPGKLDPEELDPVFADHVGGSFDTGILGDLTAKLEALPGVEKVRFTVEADGDERRLRAAVTPTLPEVSGVEIVPVGSDGVELDRKALTALIETKVGDRYEAEALAEALAEIEMRDDVVAAEMRFEEDGERVKIVVEVTPAKRTPLIVSGLEFEPEGGGALDLSKVREAAGVGVGDVFSPALLRTVEERLKRSPRFEDAQVSAKETPEGYRLIAKVTPAAPTIAEVQIDLPDGADIDPKKVEAALNDAGVVAGAEWEESEREKIIEKLMGLGGIERVELEMKEVELGGAYRLVAKFTLVRVLGAGPHAIAGIEFEVPDGAEFDVEEALEATGIRPGAEVSSAHLGALGRKLEKLNGVAKAVVEMKEIKGVVRLVATVEMGDTADPPAPPEPEAVEPAPRGEGRNEDLSAALGETDIYFWTGSVAISRRDEAKLERAAEAIVAAGNRTRISVTGFSDPRGDQEANRKLSLLRAEAVCAYLEKRGVKREFLEPSGAGIPGEESLEKQRRVEVRPAA